ncbi:WAT1-related protein At1g25270-like [Diospyros lotus]|uniref:WAT1-related protein At1g25270-like n=1 Tax=Diospyros lotus TaxID=55363 RepID=UPI00224FBEEB|nr:WAT1-related protein At1g25270-like [Diospyros lotus]
MAEDQSPSRKIGLDCRRGSLFQNLYLESMASTSPTFISAIVNLTPAIAFLLCLAFRLESLSAKRHAKIKVAGVALSIVGAALLASFKRLEINPWPVKFGFLQLQQQQKHIDNQMMGLILALLSTLSNASFLTIQAKFEVKSGNIFLLPFLMNLMAAIQSVVYALFAEKDKTQWKLGWNVRLWAACSAGVLGSGLSTTIITWCISEMGPLFVSTANPFGLILMTATGYFLLGEKLHVTSLAAIALIIVAILLILWGEVKELSDKEAERSDHQEVELGAVREA